MKAFLLRLALVTAALVPVTSALAADLDAPPPVEGTKPKAKTDKPAGEKTAEPAAVKSEEEAGAE